MPAGPSAGWAAPRPGPLTPPGPGTVDLWHERLAAGSSREAARGRVRDILARYTAGEPVVLVSGPHGKPELDPPLVRLSVTHSGDVLLVAVSADAEVGVDVEVPRPGRPVEGLARRIWGEAAASELAALPTVEREREFHRRWVRHEARLKCLGVGLGAPAPDVPVAVVDLDLGLGDGTQAALAREGGPPVVIRGLRA